MPNHRAPDSLKGDTWQERPTHLLVRPVPLGRVFMAHSFASAIRKAFIPDSGRRTSALTFTPGPRNRVARLCRKRTLETERCGVTGAESLPGCWKAELAQAANQR